jgi:hypothetical protein
MNFTKTFLLGVLSFLMVQPLSAQDVTESVYPYMKKEKAPGFSIVVLGDPKNVEVVIEQLIEAQSKAKAKSDKGMMVFENAQFSPISSEKNTYYFTLDNPSRKDKEHTLVTMFVRDGIGQFVTSITGPRTAENGISWLEELEINVKIYEMSLVLEDQTKVLEKEMKAQSNLVDDSVALQKTLIDLNASIEDNHQAITDQKGNVNEEAKRLENFRAKLEALKEERRTQQATRRQQGRNNRD